MILIGQIRHSRKEQEKGIVYHKVTRAVYSILKVEWCVGGGEKDLRRVTRAVYSILKVEWCGGGGGGGGPKTCYKSSL